MGLFDIFNKPAKTQTEQSSSLIYELLFCDNLDLYRKSIREPYLYPWNILFSETKTASDLMELVQDESLESRFKILAYNELAKFGQRTDKQEILAVIVEVGLENGLDVLASFRDGTARYINQSGKILIWETTDAQSNALTDRIFAESTEVVSRIGAWDKPRRPEPAQGSVRLTFLVSDGFYFGEGPIDSFFNDPLASPVLSEAGNLMIYLTEKVIGKAGA